MFLLRVPLRLRSLNPGASAQVMGESDCFGSPQKRVHSRLDEETSSLVREKAELLAQRHPDVLAIILYGSVARHEERSLEGPDPSDVDLLVVINGNRDAVRSQILALVHTAGLAEDRHLGAPREVKVLFSSRTSQEWDPEFIANVKRDGRILYRRGELPAPFAA